MTIRNWPTAGVRLLRQQRRTRESVRYLLESFNMLSMDARFRYIDAPQVATPAGRLKGTTLVSPTNATLGTLDGIVIDPMARRVLFYVFKSPGWFSSHHYLLPQMPARLNSQRHTLEVEVEAADLEQLDEVEPASFPRFSDEDLLRAMFHSRPA